MSWRVRTEFDLRGTLLDTPERVLVGLRDGDWEPSDEVRGPTDTAWVPIEDHPAFAEAVAEMGPPPTRHPDETHLDMNPMIDVALVLLIFFILTATYTSMKRAIGLPDSPSDDGTTKQVVKQDVQDRIFRVSVTVDVADKPVVKIDNRAINFDEMEKEFRDHIKATGRKEILLTVTDDVKWGYEAKVHDAAKGAGVLQIYWPKPKK